MEFRTLLNCFESEGFFASFNCFPGLFSMVQSAKGQPAIGAQSGRFSAVKQCCQVLAHGKGGGQVCPRGWRLTNASVWKNWVKKNICHDASARLLKDRFWTLHTSLAVASCLKSHIINLLMDGINTLYWIRSSVTLLLLDFLVWHMYWLRFNSIWPNVTKQTRKSVLALRNGVFSTVVLNLLGHNNGVLHNALLKATHWFRGIQQLHVYLFDPLLNDIYLLRMQKKGGFDSHLTTYHNSVFPTAKWPICSGQKGNLAKSNQDSRGSYRVSTYLEGSRLERMGMNTFTQELYSQMRMPKFDTLVSSCGLSLKIVDLCWFLCELSVLFWFKGPIMSRGGI